MFWLSNIEAYPFKLTPILSLCGGLLFVKILSNNNAVDLILPGRTAIVSSSNSTGCTMSGRLCNTRTGPYLNEDDEENTVKSVKIADHNPAF